VKFDSLATETHAHTLGGLISSYHTLIEVELRQMITMEDVFIEVVSIIHQHPSNSLDAVLDDMF
jgi:hypothetical protein